MNIRCTQNTEESKQHQEIYYEYSEKEKVSKNG